MKRWITTLFVVAATTVYGQKNTGYDAITERGLKAKVAFLSSDLLEGRECGERGSFIAAEYIAAQFVELGLIPVNPQTKGILTPYQFPLGAIKTTPKGVTLTVSDKGVNHTFTETADIAVATTVINNFNTTGNVVFYTEDAPVADYAGKIVATTNPKAARRIVNAAAVLLFDSTAWGANVEKNAFTYHHNEPIYEGKRPRKIFSDYRVVLENTQQGTPVINVSARVYQLLQNADKIALQIKVDTERKYLRNVIGMIEGQIKEEYVVIGTHFDHLGIKDGYIYNGADDNASGTAAVMEIAKAFVHSGEKPLRTIVFALWDGEERGSLGSRAFTASIDYRDKIKGYINFDMIGRDSDEKSSQSFAYMYSKSAPAFETWLKRAIKEYKLPLKPNYAPLENATGGSDNTAFAMYGIPIVWYHTGGNPDYHQPSDTAEKINWTKITDITRSAYLLLYDMANEQ